MSSLEERNTLIMIAEAQRQQAAVEELKDMVVAQNLKISSLAGEFAELKKVQVLKTAAETDKIRSETGDTGEDPIDPLERMEKAAGIDKTQSETSLNEAKRIDTLRQDPPRSMQ